MTRAGLAIPCLSATQMQICEMIPLEKTTQPDCSAEGLADVRTRIGRACRDNGRQESDVELVCVSKNFGADAIRPVLDAGQRVFGENRIQEASQKWPELRRGAPDVRLHLIGPLQSNKAADAVALFDVIETVDRPKIAQAIAQAMRSSGKTPRLFVQVNTGEEFTKGRSRAFGSRRAPRLLSP